MLKTKYTFKHPHIQKRYTETVEYWVKTLEGKTANELAHVFEDNTVVIQAQRLKLRIVEAFQNLLDYAKKK